MQLRQERKEIRFKPAFVQTTSLQVVVGFVFFFFLQDKFCPGIQQQGDACKVVLLHDEAPQFAGTGPRLILPHQKVKGRCCENRVSSTRYPGTQLLRDRACPTAEPCAGSSSYLDIPPEAGFGPGPPPSPPQGDCAQRDMNCLSGSRAEGSSTGAAQRGLSTGTGCTRRKQLSIHKDSKNGKDEASPIKPSPEINSATHACCWRKDACTDPLPPQKMQARIFLVKNGHWELLPDTICVPSYQHTYSTRLSGGIARGCNSRLVQVMEVYSQKRKTKTQTNQTKIP